jgi:hypothetical protein
LAQIRSCAEITYLSIRNLLFGHRQESDHVMLLVEKYRAIEESIMPKSSPAPPSLVLLFVSLYDSIRGPTILLASLFHLTGDSSMSFYSLIIACPPWRNSTQKSRIQTITLRQSLRARIQKRKNSRGMKEYLWLGYLCNISDA